MKQNDILRENLDGQGHGTGIDEEVRNTGGTRRENHFPGSWVALLARGENVW